MKAKIFDKTGKKVGDVILTKEIFEAKVHPQVLRTAIEYLRTRARHNFAHVKTRGERRGGGAKPWRQKGTGNARHSSIRSPLWRKGGVTFGPRNTRNFKIKMNTREKRQAFLGALSKRAEQNNILVLKELPTKEIKTQPYAKLFAKLPLTRRALFIVPAQEKNGILSVKNLPQIHPAKAHNFNTLDILKNQQIVITKKALEELQDIFGSKPATEQKRKSKPKISSKKND